MNGPRRFALFWYDFIVGDDWLLAAGVVVALAVAALLGMAGFPAAWIILPSAIIATLIVSIRRAVPSNDDQA
ncbi:MAG: hypothetical protein WAV00_08965 [Nocardioides sp.]